MAEAPILPRSPLQSQIVQKALEFATKLEETAQGAPVGGVLDACEAFILGDGRQFLRDSLAATTQQEIDHAEKKGARHGPVPVDTPAATRALALVTSSPPSDSFASAAPSSPVRNANSVAISSMTASAWMAD
jgi:hypothetical protein